MGRMNALIKIAGGAVFAGALFSCAIGWAERIMNDALAWIGIGAALLYSIAILPLAPRLRLARWHGLVVVLTAGIGLYGSLVFTEVEFYRLIFVPGATVVFALLAFLVYLFRDRKKEAAGHSGEPLLFAAVSVAVAVIVLPAVVGLYLRYLAPPPLVPHSPAVVYDYVFEGTGRPVGGLYVDCSFGTKGDFGNHDWLAAAYLVSREWYDSPDEPWREGNYVRRARFYHLDIKSFDRNDNRDFEAHRCNWNQEGNDGLFLPYDVVVEGRTQSEGRDIRPEPLAEIISASDKVQFGVEFVTVVSSSRSRKAEESVYGDHRRRFFTLDGEVIPYAGAHSEDDRFERSRWRALVSGGPASTPLYDGMVPAPASTTAFPATETPPSMLNQPAGEEGTGSAEGEISHGNWNIF